MKKTLAIIITLVFMLNIGIAAYTANADSNFGAIVDLSSLSQLLSTTEGTDEITARATPSEAGEITKSYDGTNYTFTAQEKEGYEFVAWYAGISTEPYSTDKTITVPHDSETKTYIALFVRETTASSDSTSGSDPSDDSSSSTRDISDIMSSVSDRLSTSESDDTSGSDQSDDSSSSTMDISSIMSSVSDRLTTDNITVPSVTVPDASQHIAPSTTENAGATADASKVQKASSMMSSLNGELAKANEPETIEASKKQTTTAAKKSNKPKKTSIKKLTAQKNGFKAVWGKVSSAKGYQIKYSTSKKFTKKTSKTVTVKKSGTTSKTVKKLKSKKKYYVKVRTYKTVNGKKVYSDWSKVKTVKTK